MPSNPLRASDMMTLQDLIDELSATPAELRAKIIAERGEEAVRDAWRASGDATALARMASLLLPREVVARGLCACVRGFLSAIHPLGAPLLQAVDAVERWARGDASLEDVRQGLESIPPLPGAEDPDYDAHAAILNLHKFLFADPDEGLRGVDFFCTEGMLSNELPTWESAGRRTADLFRAEIGDPMRHISGAA